MEDFRDLYENEEEQLRREIDTMEFQSKNLDLEKIGKKLDAIQRDQAKDGLTKGGKKGGQWDFNEKFRKVKDMRKGEEGGD